MKKILVIIITIVVFSAGALTAQDIPNTFASGEVVSAAAMNENFQTLMNLYNAIEGGGVVGDIVQSILTEAQFQSQRGVSWVLMDGRNVSGSQYEIITGKSTIPDGRGMFLRTKNNERVDGNENPAGDLTLGTYEADQFQGHYHDYAIASNSIIIRNSPESQSWVESGTDDSSYITFVSPNFYITDPVADGTNGAPRTGSETRPKSITVNTFIKIN